VAGIVRPQAPSLAGEAPDSPLGQLMAERQALEARMQRLTGGTAASDPRAAALYQVRPMAERRAEHQAWLARREAVHVPTDQEPVANPSRTAGETERPRATGRPTPSEPPLRPTPGEALRRPERGTPEDSRRFAELRDQLSGLRGGLSQLRDLDRSFADADRQLAAEGMERERGELEEMRRSTGLDKLAAGAEKLDGVLARGTSIADAPRRAGELIERDWLRRRDRIGGPDLERYERGFRERAAKLFGVDTGSTDQLEDRMARLREGLSARRRAAREDEERDEARRDRALERRRERRDER
jgi:hypothetical protein